MSVSSPPPSPPEPEHTALGNLAPLRARGIIKGPTTGAKRKVSAAFLSPPSSNLESSRSLSSSSSGSSSTASISYRNVSDISRCNPELVIQLESPDLFEHLGFTTEASQIIFDRWSSRPDQDVNPDSMLDYALGHIAILDTPPYTDMDAHAAYTTVGISADLCERLTDPVFSMLFYTETPHFWLKTTIEIEWHNLLRTHDRIRDEADNEATRPSGRRSAKRSRGGAADIQLGSTAHTGNTEQRLLATMQTLSALNLPQQHVSVASAPPLLHDHVWLFRAQVPDASLPWITDDGSLNSLAISSVPGGDFNHRALVSYWTDDKDVAEQYRLWAARRNPSSESWLISIQVSQAFLATLKKNELWYSFDWKEFVWHCKKRLQPPARFDELWKHGRTGLLKGHICTGVQHVVARIKREHVQTRLTESHLIHSPSSGRKAVQWVFMQDDSIDALSQEIRGKIHIDITAATHRRTDSGEASEVV